MYFWNTNALKQKLIEHPLTGRKAFPYYAAYAIFVAINITYPLTGWYENRGASHFVLFCVIFVLGTVYAHYCNGGAHGSDFLTRYAALGWVTAVRILVLAWLLGAVQGFLDVIANIDPVKSDLLSSMILIALVIGYYWRLGHHIRDVAARAGTTNGQPESTVT
jgi:hypothetical protein